MAVRSELRAYSELLKLAPIGEAIVRSEEVTLSEAPLRRRWISFVSVLAVALPTLIAIVFFGFVAANRYESETRFVIRNPTRASSPAFSSALQGTGLLKSAGDAYAVKEYLLSRDAVQELAVKGGLKDSFARPEGDFFWRFPNFYSQSGSEGLYKQYRRFVTVDYDDTTGVTTLKTQAFRATDAQRLTQSLLEAAESFVNRLNERAQHDTVAFAQAEVDRMQQRAITSQEELTAYRNREALLDPSHTALAVFEGIARLSLEAAEINMQISETERAAPQSPRLTTLKARSTAIEKEIANERLKLTGNSDALSNKISEYERLVLEREFSERALMASLGAVEIARSEAQRQRIYLERVASPSLPDYPFYPYRLLSISVVAVVSFLTYRGLRTLTRDILRHTKLAAHL